MIVANTGSVGLSYDKRRPLTRRPTCYRVTPSQPSIA